MKLQTQHHPLSEDVFMEFWSFVVASIVLHLVVFFIDENTVLELRLLFHALTKAVCHLYLALLPLRRAAGHFAKGVRCMIGHLQLSDYCSDKHQSKVLEGGVALHFLEGTCAVCEMVPHLMSAALSALAATCHMLQGGFYVLQAILRSFRGILLSDDEKESWDKEQHRAKEREKKLNSKVVEYVSVFCQDPVSALRIKPHRV